MTEYLHTSSAYPPPHTSVVSIHLETVQSKYYVDRVCTPVSKDGKTTAACSVQTQFPNVANPQLAESADAESKIWRVDC